MAAAMMRAKACRNTCERPDLTQEELIVALELWHGWSYSFTAARLGLNFETFRTRLAKIRKKTGYRLHPQLSLWSSRQLHWLKSQRLNIALKHMRVQFTKEARHGRHS